MNPVINKLKPMRINSFRGTEQQHAIKPLDKIAAVVYTSEAPEASLFYARGYLRSGMNPKFNYRFTTDAKRETFVKEWVQGLVDREASKIAARATKKAATHNLTVGSILNTSWGYDQTNVDYFQVVAIKSKTMVMLREIAQIQHDDSHVLPARDSFIGKPFAKRVHPQWSSIKISSCQTAFPTDKADVKEGTYGFRPSYKTPWGMGH